MEIPCLSNSPMVGAVQKDKITIERIFPNPASEELFVKIESTNEVMTSLYVYDIMGSLVMNLKVPLESGMNTLPIDISNIAAGLYQLNLVDSSGKISTVKFVKQRD